MKPSDRSCRRCGRVGRCEATRRPFPSAVETLGTPSLAACTCGPATRCFWLKRISAPRTCRPFFSSSIGTTALGRWPCCWRLTPATPPGVRRPWPKPWASSSYGCPPAAPTSTRWNTSGAMRKAPFAPTISTRGWRSKSTTLSITSRAFLLPNGCIRPVCSPAIFGFKNCDINFADPLRSSPEKTHPRFRSTYFHPGRARSLLTRGCLLGLARSFRYPYFSPPPLNANLWLSPLVPSNL